MTTTISPRLQSAIEHATQTLQRYAKDKADHRERVQCIADCLRHVYGTSADDLMHRMFPADDAAEKYGLAWRPYNESDHPRGPNGRWIKKHSDEAYAHAKHAIGEALKGKRTATSAHELVGHLGNLSVKQLHQLKKEHGISASGELKADLIDRIAGRLDKGRRVNEEEDNTKVPSFEEAMMQAHGIDKLPKASTKDLRDRDNAALVAKVAAKKADKDKSDTLDQHVKDMAEEAAKQLPKTVEKLTGDKLPEVPGQQRGLFNTEASGQKKLFDVIAPPKTKAKPVEDKKDEPAPIVQPESLPGQTSLLGDDLESKIRDHIAANPNVELRELQHAMGHGKVDPQKPLQNPVNQAIVSMRDRGEIHVDEPRFGSPRVKLKEPAKPNTTSTETKNTELPNDAPGVSENDIPYQAAYNAHAMSSFVPERRAKQRQQEYVAQMNADWQHLKKYATTDEKKAVLHDEFARYKAGFRDKTLAVLHAGSRTASAMITGPSRFPTASNRKKVDAYDKRIGELIEFRERAMKAIARKLRPEDGPIKSSDSNAVEKLQAELASLEKHHEQMKKINDAHKKFLKDPASLDKSDLSDKSKAIVRSYKPQYSWEPHPVAPFMLTNNSANIRRIKERIESVSKMKAGPEKEESYSGGVTVHEDPEAARIRIRFPGKPPRETISELKSHGFRWSPSETAWQRHLNEGGRHAVNRVLEKLGHTKRETSQSEIAKEPDVPPIMKTEDHEPISKQYAKVRLESAIHHAYQKLQSYELAK